MKKYTKLMDDYLNTTTPQVGDKWHADEVWLKIRGLQEIPLCHDGQWYRALDGSGSSGFQVQAWHQKLITMGKQATKNTPAVFVTDGLPAYHDAFKKEFWTRKKPGTKHANEIYIKDRGKQQHTRTPKRWIQGSWKGISRSQKRWLPAIAGIKLYHNYVRPHMSLDGDTPADRAGIKITGENKWNKWLTIIQNASLDT